MSVYVFVYAGFSLETFVIVIVVGGVPPPAQSVGALRCLHFFSQRYSESTLPAEMIPIKLKGLPKGLPIGLHKCIPYEQIYCTC